MDLLSLVRRRLVLPQLGSQEKFAAIEELLDFLVSEDEVSADHRAVVEAAVRRREEERETGVGKGVALPHGVVDLGEEEVAAIGLSREGICFGGPDGQPSSIIILLVTPRSLAYRHPQNVARIAFEMNQHQLRSDLADARSTAEILDILETLSQL